MDSTQTSSQPALQFLEPGFSDDTKPRCTVCGKVFKRMYALERHVVVHDPQRALLEFKCPLEGCTFSSLQKSNVKTHVAAVHEKVKHTCTLPRTAEDARASGTPENERCGRIFSDVPALIRHEKRAHEFYRRGPNAKARPSLQKAATRSTDDTRSKTSQSPTATDDDSDLRCQRAVERSPSDEKVQYWLQGSEARTSPEMDWDQDSVTPCATFFPRDQTCHAGLIYASAPGQIASSSPHATSTCLSDAESAAIGSVSSSISTSPSPGPPELALTNPQYYQTPAVQPYPQACQQGYYHPYNAASVQQQAYEDNRTYSLHPAQFSPTQTQSVSVAYFDNESAHPPMEAWLPQHTEMKNTMQPDGYNNSSVAAEWDGTVTSYRAFFE